MTGNQAQALGDTLFIHVVEHDSIHPGCNRLQYIVPGPAFDFNGRTGFVSVAQSGNRGRDGSSLVDVIVLEHEHLGQVEAMISPSADQNGVFFRIAKTWQGLAGVQEMGGCTLKGLDKAVGQGGNPGEVRQIIEDDPLRFEQQGGRPAQGADVLGSEDPAAFICQVLDIRFVSGRACPFQDERDQGQTGNNSISLGYYRGLQDFLLRK